MQKVNQHTAYATDAERLEAYTYGDNTKPPLILVHGFPDQHTVWDRVIPHLVDDFYVVTYDVRGAGASAHPDMIKSYRLPQLSRDLRAVNEQVLDGRPFHLAAHDWGSIQSWESVTDPDFAGKILSYSSMSGPSQDHAAHLIRRMIKHPARLVELLKPSLYIGRFHIPFLATRYWRNFTAEKWQANVIQLEQCDDIPLNPDVPKNGEYGINLYRANFIPRLLKPGKRYAQCPVQAILLTHDSFVRPEYVDEMRNWVENFEVAEIESNHWAPLSHPEQVATHIRDFALKFAG